MRSYGDTADSVFRLSLFAKASISVFKCCIWNADAFGIQLPFSPKGSLQSFPSRFAVPRAYPYHPIHTTSNNFKCLRGVVTMYPQMDARPRMFLVTRA